MFPFLGVKGGVGCSVLASLFARVSAKNKKIKIGLIDATPFSQSLTPTFLTVDQPKHFLTQLLPYSEHLTPKLIESYFSETPEGVYYVPVKENDDLETPFHLIFPLLTKLTPLFDFLFIDLSSFPTDQHLKFLENCPSAVIISSFDSTALRAVTRWEKRLLPLHLNLENFYILFNQQNPSQIIPADFSSIPKYFTHLGFLNCLGDDLPLHLLEKDALTPPLVKTLNSIAEKIIDLGKIPHEVKSPQTDSTPNRTEDPGSPEKSDSVSLEEVNHLHQKLLEKLRQSGVLKEQKSGDPLQRKVLEPAAKEILNGLIQDMNIQNRETRLELASKTLNLAFGLGPLEPLLQNDEITEIMVNGPNHVYVEKRGLIEKTNISFLNDLQLRTIIERILAPIGRRIDEGQPYVDGRLSDGSRVNAIIHPLSLNGSVITIRKFSQKKLTVDDLIKFGSLTQEAADFLGACVKAKKNIIVSGGTGSGKTTLLNILSNYIPRNERIVTIEDSAELQLSQDHVVRLEARPANLEGKGQVSIRDLVINALRMRPDRIVVGECRGGEALDMLQAMNTGHDGSLTTAHANTPRDVLTRLETMCLFTGLDLPVKAVREQISRALHLVVQQSRLSNGKRAVTQISEVQGMEGDTIITQDLFYFDEEKGLQRRPFAPLFIEGLISAGYKWPGHREKMKA